MSEYPHLVEIPPKVIELSDNMSMMGRSSWFVEQYRGIMEEKADPRVADWMLMSSPLATVILCLTYLLIVRVLGPLFMANREPYDLKYPMLAYNLFQTLFNGWIFLGAASFWFGGKYNWVCQAVDYSTDPQAISALSLAWWFYFSKFIDFFDSFFFLLRKKFDHLSTLHVVHHSTLPFFSWFGAKYAGGGNTSFGGMWNTLVHVCMYTYYFLAACGPEVQKHLWWKKYLTSMQMVQFVIVFFHSFISLIYSSCGFSKFVSLILMFNGLLYWFLFLNFYRKSYQSKKVKKLDMNANKKED